MPLLNYTTKISVEKTIAEIEKLLAQSSAQKIMKEYDVDGNVESISFVINTEQGMIPFKLPMNAEPVMQTINAQTGEYKRSGNRQRRVVPSSMYNDMDQARRVGWRIIKDWLEAQLALYFLQMVKIEEIFLPYMYSNKHNKTMFQLMQEKNFEDILRLE